MDFPTLLKQLCKEFGMDEPEDLSKAKYTLILNEKHRLHIELSSSGDFFTLFACLAPLIEGHVEPLSRLIMEENQFGKITGPATISISKEKRTFILSERFCFKLIQPKGFTQRLKEWIGILDYLEEKLPKWQLCELSQGTSSADKPEDHGVIKMKV